MSARENANLNQIDLAPDLFDIRALANAARGLLDSKDAESRADVQHLLGMIADKAMVVISKIDGEPRSSR